MALDELNKFLSACFSTFDPDIEYDCDTAIRTADKYGVNVPDHIRKHNNIYVAKLYEQRKAKLQKDADEIAEKLRNLGHE